MNGRRAREKRLCHKLIAAAANSRIAAPSKFSLGMPDQAARGLRLLNILWAVTILYSVIATRQHVFIDLACSVAPGAIIAQINFLWLR